MRKGLTVIIPNGGVEPQMKLFFSATINSGRYYPATAFNYAGTATDPSDPANAIFNLANVAGAPLTISKLAMYTDQPGAGEFSKVTLYKNGVAQTLVASVNGTDNFAVDSTHSVTLAVGDLFSFRIEKSGGSSSVSAAVYFQTT